MPSRSTKDHKTKPETEIVKTAVQTENPSLPFVFFSILVIICYFPSLQGAFVFDDLARIVANPDIVDLQTCIARLFTSHAHESFSPYGNDPSRPIVYLSYALNYYFGGLNPFGYHLFNMILQILNAVLAYILVRRIQLFTGRADRLFPVLVGSIFAVHPLNIDAVSYVYGRSDLMMTSFYLLSSYLFAGALNNSHLKLAASLACFILALFCKQSAATLPMVLLSLDFFLVSGFDVRKLIRRWFQHASFWAVLILYLLVKHFVLGGIGDVEAGQSQISFASYVATQPYVWLRYLGLHLAPIGQSIYHVVLPVQSLLDPRLLVPIAVSGILFSIGKRLFRASAGIPLFFLAWWVLNLLPTSSLLPTAQYMVERRAYLPSIGFWGFVLSVLVFTVIPALENRFHGKEKKLVFLVIAAYGLFLCGATISRNRIFADPESLWQNAATQYPSSGIIHKHLGMAYAQKGEYHSAVSAFRRSMKIDPLSTDNYGLIARMLRKMGKPQEAIANMELAVKHQPRNTIFRRELAQMYAEQGQKDRAILELDTVLGQDGNDYLALNAMGITLAQMGEYEKSHGLFVRAIRVAPGIADSYTNLGVLYLKSGQLQNAARMFTRVLELQPNDRNAAHNLAVLRKKLSANPLSPGSSTVPQ